MLLAAVRVNVEHRKDPSSTDPHKAPDITPTPSDRDAGTDSRKAPLKELLSRIEAVTWRLYLKGKDKGSRSRTSKP
jgi:hypothetical protein